MTKELLIVTIFPGAMALAAATDLFTMTVPNRLALALAAGFFLVAPLVGYGWADIGLHVAVALAALLVTFILFSFGWIGGGHYLTSTTHVENVVEGLLLAAERGTPGTIYFVSDGEPVDFREFITKLLATQGIDAGNRNVPRWLARATVALTAWMKRPPLTKTAFALMAHEVTVDDGKARRELGYVGKKSIDDGLAELRS